MMIRAYAKINLGLRIVGKRDDGYHEIETVFHRINVFDEITFEESPDISCTTNLSDILNDENNLCLRAARLLQRTYGIRKGARILLEKNIPIGAGLGGGSSDAASTFLALCKFWRISKPDLHSLTLQLGSDVPYFLNNGTAYATGRGDILEYFSCDVPYWIVAVYPNIHISTEWAYKNIQLKKIQASDKPSLKQILIEHIQTPRMLMNLIQNDFEPLVLREHKTVAETKQALYLAGADFAQLSGSGSSVYGLFSSQESARKSAETLRKKYQVFITPPHFQPEAE